MMCVQMYGCVWVWVNVYACVCVCVWEREREHAYMRFHMFVLIWHQTMMQQSKQQALDIGHKMWRGYVDVGPAY